MFSYHTDSSSRMEKDTFLLEVFSDGNKCYKNFVEYILKHKWLVPAHCNYYLFFVRTFQQDAMSSN